MRMITNFLSTLSIYEVMVICAFYVLYLGKSGRGTGHIELECFGRKKVSLINYNLSLINCSMEIKCLNLCLSKTGLEDLFEVSLLHMVNFGQGESSRSGRCMKVERRTSTLHMYFLKQH